MRPLQDLIRDERFAIARLQEEIPDVRVLPGYYNQTRPFGMLFCTGSSRILQVYSHASIARKGGQVLTIQKFRSYPSDALLFEVLSQLEKEDLLQNNHQPANAENKYSLFRICYQ